LLAIEVDVAELLPADDIGFGFDNIGDVLQVSSLLMERYLSAASDLTNHPIPDAVFDAWRGADPGEAPDRGL
jgi:hypothetical protein